MSPPSPMSLPHRRIAQRPRLQVLRFHKARPRRHPPHQEGGISSCPVERAASPFICVSYWDNTHLARCISPREGRNLLRPHTFQLPREGRAPVRPHTGTTRILRVAAPPGSAHARDKDGARGRSRGLFLRTFPRTYAFPTKFHGDSIADFRDPWLVVKCENRSDLFSLLWR